MNYLMSWLPFCDRQWIRDDRAEALPPADEDALTAPALFESSLESDEPNHEEWKRLVHILFSEAIALDSSDGLSGEQSIPPPSRVVRATQQETWDCGIACLLMALQWARHDEESTNTFERQEILQDVATKSIWSADLVWLLRRYIPRYGLPLRYLFSSQVLEVNTSLGQLDYYKSTFSKDRDRIQQIFSRIKQEQLPVIQQQRLALRRIARLVCEPNCIAIALVDNSILLGKNRQYAGHYILLLGISVDVAGLTTSYKVCFVVQNPANRPCSVDCHRLSFELFEKTWRAAGTDEDIIFLVRDDDNLSTC